MLEQTRRVQGNLPTLEDELDELFIQLGELDEGSFEVVVEGELVESLLNLTSRSVKKDRCRVGTRRVGGPTRRVRSTGS